MLVGELQQKLPFLKRSLVLMAPGWQHTAAVLGAEHSLRRTDKKQSWLCVLCTVHVLHAVMRCEVVNRCSIVRP